MSISFTPQPATDAGTHRIDPSDMDLADTQHIDITYLIAAQMEAVVDEWGRGMPAWAKADTRGQLRLTRMPNLVPERDEVLLRVLAGGVSRTDLQVVDQALSPYLANVTPRSPDRRRIY